MKQLHLTIQKLIAQKQASKTLEKRLMIQLNTARFHADQRASMNTAGSRAIDRLLCKSTPPRRIVMLGSKTPSLLYPNCITFTVLSDFIPLLHRISSEEVIQLVKDWVAGIAHFPSSVTLSAPNSRYHLETTLPRTYTIIVEHCDSMSTILAPWDTLSRARLTAGTVDLSATTFGVYARDTDVLCQIEFFMAMETVDRRLRCPTCPHVTDRSPIPISGFTVSATDRHIKFFCSLCGLFMKGPH